VNKTVDGTTRDGCRVLEVVIALVLVDTAVEVASEVIGLINEAVGVGVATALVDSTDDTILDHEVPLGSALNMGPATLGNINS
jgi:hypothetical protein